MFGLDALPALVGPLYAITFDAPEVKLSVETHELDSVLTDELSPQYRFKHGVYPEALALAKLRRMGNGPGPTPGSVVLSCCVGGQL
jgi:hypothetical protein